VNNKYINKMPFYFCTKGEKDSNRGREESIWFWLVMYGSKYWTKYINFIWPTYIWDYSSIN
jgi:hypothetical protein